MAPWPGPLPLLPGPWGQAFKLSSSAILLAPILAGFLLGGGEKGGVVTLPWNPEAVPTTEPQFNQAFLLVPCQPS